LAVREKKPTSRNIREIVKGLATTPNENTRFERLAATKDTLSLVYGNPDVYEQALNMLSGNNKLILEAGFEKSMTKRYKMVQRKLCELNISQFAVTANIFPPMEYYRLLKERCESCNDNAACMVLEERIQGDPESDDAVLRLGLMGLWEIEDNRHAGDMLVMLGVITQEEYNRITTERDKRTPIPAIIPTGEPGFVPTDQPVTPPAEPYVFVPAVPAGFEDAIKELKDKDAEWVNVVKFITDTYGYDEKLIIKATEIYYKPTLEPTPKPTIPDESIKPITELPQLKMTDMKKAIEERMEKLKGKSKEPDAPLTIKEEIMPEPTIETDISTLMYMVPTDYEQWGFGDFESIVPGLDLEDLYELLDYAGLSTVMTVQETEDVREIITKRINEIKNEGF